MKSVLGIDRAWTRTNPSGVALLIENGDDWTCSLLASKYSDLPREPRNEPELLAAIDACGYTRPCVVAIDMPMSRLPISGRRLSDDQVSAAFGRFKCGTHSPSAHRPGPIAEEVRESFETSGFALQTCGAIYTERSAHLIEVYPHPALVRLANASERLCYKVGKTNSYWRGESLTRRIHLVVEVLEKILGLLRSAGVKVELEIPHDVSLTALKAYEDKVDALVCAWVGVEYLRDHIEPYGDATSTIWIPKALGCSTA